MPQHTSKRMIKTNPTIIINEQCFDCQETCFFGPIEMTEWVLTQVTKTFE
jgi:hypothetical protein